MRRFVTILFLYLPLSAFSQIYPVLPGEPYEKYVDSTQIVFHWRTSSPSDSRVRIGKTPNYELGEFINSAITTDHEVRITGLEPATIYYVQIASYGIINDSIKFITSTSSDSRSTGEINVYFNKSVDSTVSIGIKANGNINLKDKLIERINGARYSIDFCFFNLSTDIFGNVGHEIANALISARDRGVKVRVIVDANKADNAPVRRLMENGIPVLSKSASGLMHNKFVVFDYRDSSAWDNVWVWTGSWNATVYGTYDNYQNVIEIQDRAIAGAFTLEFEEMWGSRGDMYDISKAKLGTEKTDNTPHVFNIRGKRVEVYFSPSDDVDSRIIRAIRKADHSIYFALLTFTRDELARAIKEEYDSGVRDIKGILDNNTDIGSEYSFLSTFADILIDKDTEGKLHHKYCLIDPTHLYSEPILITGSYNWSWSAEHKNDENVLIIYNVPDIVNQYLQEFSARYRQNGGVGTIVHVGNDPEVRYDFNLWQNFPNPFNFATKIYYSIPSDGRVIFRIFDPLGREVAVIVDEYQNAGKYMLNLKSEDFNLSSGIYFYRLDFVSSDGIFTKVKKMTLIK